MLTVVATPSSNAINYTNGSVDPVNQAEVTMTIRNRTNS